MRYYHLGFILILFVERIIFYIATKLSRHIFLRVVWTIGLKIVLEPSLIAGFEQQVRIGNVDEDVNEYLSESCGFVNGYLIGYL